MIIAIIKRLERGKEVPICLMLCLISKGFENCTSRGEKCSSAGMLTTFGLDLLLTADYHPKFSLI